jgi:hypothetical protein
MVIHIHQETRQKDLLEELSSVENYENDLYIRIVSLPIYLSTSIAFNIFSYRLRKYPRKIIWVSHDDKILEILKITELNIDLEYFKKNEKPEAKEKILPSLKLENRYSTEEFLNQFASSDFNIDSLKDASELIDNPSLPKTEEKIFQNLNIKTTLETEKKLENPEDLEVKKLQNLDAWLKRVEATRIALDNIRGEDANKIFGTNEIFSRKNFDPNKVIEKIKSRNMSNFSFFSAFFASCVFLIFLLVLFPTNVYTLEVVPQEIESSINLSIPTESFSKKTVKISKTANRQASGVDKNTTERAVGKVKLQNNSLQDVKIDFNNFYLEKNSNRYYFTSNSTIDSQIVLPSNNLDIADLSTISVQSENPGTEYNLVSGERMEVYNQLGQKICDNCFATTTEPIVGRVIQGGKVVTTKDQELLRTTIEGLLVNERLNEIESLKSDAVFTDLGWYKNLDSVFVYNKALGDVATDLELKVDVTTSIYYIPRSVIEQILTNENTEIKNLKKIELKKSNGNFVVEEDKINLEFLYSYTKESNLDKKQIKKELLAVTPQTIPNLQQNNPNIRRVKSKNVGLPLPFVPRRVDINIIEPK